MEELTLYKQWLDHQLEDNDLIAELSAIDGNKKEIKDRFWRNLEFGTGGLRGIIGAGTNRMNIYTIRHATQGLAEYIKSLGGNSCAVAFDSRIKSDYFAREAACVLAANGITTHIFDTLRPTPCLSFAVRELGCAAGIMVTASHNPAIYNGYKAYGSDGAQLTGEGADFVAKAMDKIDIFADINYIPFDQAVNDGLIKIIDETLMDKFYERVGQTCVHPEVLEKTDLKVVYTPLNGAGNVPVRKMFEICGLKNVSVVKEQENPDGNFPTCPYPNPESDEALMKGMLCLRRENADILIATDPDCDRCGVAVPDHSIPPKATADCCPSDPKTGGVRILTGNEIGSLMLYYICENSTLPKNPKTVKSIVSTRLVDKIAAAYGVELSAVLTGFKYIGEFITDLADKGEESSFIFGFEESYGYLRGTHCRDKDAVFAAMFMAEIAAFYKKKNMTLTDVLDEIEQKFGKVVEDVECREFPGEDGVNKMNSVMSALRKTSPSGAATTDFLDSSATGLPASDVLKFTYENGSTVFIRPSGTEPKMKVYYSVNSETELAKMQAEFNKVFN